MRTAGHCSQPRHTSQSLILLYCCRLYCSLVSGHNLFELMEKLLRMRLGSP